MMIIISFIVISSIVVLILLLHYINIIKNSNELIIIHIYIYMYIHIHYIYITVCVLIAHIVICTHKIIDICTYKCVCECVLVMIIVYAHVRHSNVTIRASKLQGSKLLNAKSSQGFAATAWKVRKASNHGFVGSLGFWSVLIAVAQGMAFTAAIVLWRPGLSSGPGCCRCDGPGMSNWGRPWPKKWENLLSWRRGRKT
jgi:hypothetical protein